MERKHLQIAAVFSSRLFFPFCPPPPDAPFVSLSRRLYPECLAVPLRAHIPSSFGVSAEIAAPASLSHTAATLTEAVPCSASRAMRDHTRLLLPLISCVSAAAASVNY